MKEENNKNCVINDVVGDFVQNVASLYILEPRADRSRARITGAVYARFMAVVSGLSSIRSVRAEVADEDPV